MTDALIVEDDEAYALARDIADRRGTTLTEAVVAALRAYDRPAASEDGLSATQHAEREIIRALVREARAHHVANVPTGHDDLYDEFGLPV